MENFRVSINSLVHHGEGLCAADIIIVKPENRSLGDYTIYHEDEAVVVEFLVIENSSTAPETTHLTVEFQAAEYSKILKIIANGAGDSEDLPI